MKNTIVCVAMFCLICFQLTAQMKNATNEYRWKQSQLGGGGFITGILQDPKHSNTLYIRSDVGGVFKTTNGAKSWVAVNNGMVHPWDHNVETFAISKHNTNVLFRCTGELRKGTSVGTIYKSINAGASWYAVCNEADFFGNGPTRSQPERIEVDPFDSTFVAVASYSKGLFISNDGGEHWSQQGFYRSPMNFLKFHPYEKNKLYLITSAKHTDKNYLFPTDTTAAPGKSIIRVSTDKGKTWQVVYEQEKGNIEDLAFDELNPLVIYMSCGRHGIKKSVDGGKTFAAIVNGLPANGSFNGLVTVKGKPGLMVTVASKYPGQKDMPDLPIYISYNAGENWQILKQKYSRTDFIDLPAHFDRPEVMSWAMGKVVVDYANISNIYIANLFSCIKTENLGQTWQCYNLKGLENICIENLQKDPLSKKVWFVAADVQPGFSVDDGVSYRELSYLDHPNTYYSSTAILPSKFKKDFIIYGIINTSTQKAAIVTSEDGGSTRKFALHLKQGLFIQTLRESQHTPGTFYMYVDGKLADSAGIYQSKDWGANWTYAPLSFPSHLQKLPFKKLFIEGELLAVTAEQVKNVCGTNQLMEVDPFQKNVIYLAEATEGLFAINTAKSTIVNIGKGLPFSSDSAAILNCIKVHPFKKGVLFAGFIKHGLWKTENGGKTWSKVYPLNNIPFNANTFDIGGVMGNTIVIGCEPMYYSPCKSALMVSTDGGKMFKNIIEPSLGAIRIKTVAVNNKNQIFIGTSGNSLFYLVDKHNSTQNNHAKEY